MENREYIEKLRENDLVREKDLGGGISSFNFKNKCFFDNLWDEQTVKARGLFVDVGKMNIVARSFDKFFYVDENGSTCKEKIKGYEYPLYFYEKHNGYLGIASSSDGKSLFTASKSTDKGDFKEWFEEILADKLGDKVDDFVKCLHENNASAVFEVIDPIHDPHIVEYPYPKVILLALVRNTFEYEHLGTTKLYNVALHFGFEVPQLLGVAMDYGQFVEMSKSIERKDGIEGCVVYDANMVPKLKVKTHWYRYWKNVRTAIANIVSDKPTNFEKNLRRCGGNIELYVFLAKNASKENCDVIELRNAYYEHVFDAGKRLDVEKMYVGTVEKKEGGKR